MWAAFKDLIFMCIQGVYGFVGDWGMAILIVTLIFRIIISPLMQRQIKSSYEMTRMQPKMKELQDKYKDDQMRLQEEMQKLYADAHFNPLAGCLPILLQMPIFMALFQVLREMGQRVTSTYEFYNLVKDLTLTPSSSLQQGVMVFIPYVTLLIIFAGATFLPMMLQQMGQPDSQQKRQTLMMSAIMSLMMLWIGWQSPAGVLLFWGVSSLYGVAQQQITMSVLKKEDAAKKEEQIEVAPVQVEVTRKQKKKRPTKKN